MQPIQEQAALNVKGISKTYGKVVAVESVSFTVPRGRIFGLLGPNGAGKTTSIRMISGLLSPNKGSVELMGMPLSAKNIGSIGLCPQELAIWDNLTVMEQLLYAAALYDVPKDLAKERAKTLLDELQMTPHQRKLGSALSGGMKRRLNIMLALMHDPDILILDEPQAGLDPQSRLLVRDYIQGLRGKKTVLITTHDMEEAEKLLDEVAIVDSGRVLDCGSPSALKAKYMDHTIVRMSWRKELGTPQEAFGSLYEEILSLAKLERMGDRLDLNVKSAEDASGLYLKLQAWILKYHLPIYDLELRQPSLEDLFIQLTGRSMRE